MYKLQKSLAGRPITSGYCCLNCAYRKKVNCHRWDSVKELSFWLGRMECHHLINMRSLLFPKLILVSPNSVIRGLAVKVSHFSLSKVLAPESVLLQYSMVLRTHKKSNQTPFQPM